MIPQFYKLLAHSELKPRRITKNSRNNPCVESNWCARKNNEQYRTQVRASCGHRYCIFRGPCATTPLGALPQTIRAVLHELAYSKRRNRPCSGAGNLFIETGLQGDIIRNLTEEEIAVYRDTFLNPGESDRPMITFSRQLPLTGTPSM
jgi:hypothetical protein